MTVLVMVGLALSFVSSALAVEPPQIRGELFREEIHSTRASVEVSVADVIGEGTWTAGYSTSENPKSSGGEWVPAGKGTIAQNDNDTISIGEVDETTPGSVQGQCHVLHHLLPGTSYFAHFEVKTEGGTSEKTFKFTTAPTAGPEITEICGLQGSTFRETHGTRSTQAFAAQVETNNTPTEYHFEYTTEAPPGNRVWTPFNTGASGLVSPVTVSNPLLGEASFVENDFAELEASLTGLKPETQYFVRLRACREKMECTGEKICSSPGCVEDEKSFATPTAKPVVITPEFRNVTATSAHIFSQIDPNGSETDWRYEYTSEPENATSWKLIDGDEGIISQSQAENLPENTGDVVEGPITGLSPSTSYCVRAFASGQAGEGENFFGESILGEKRGWGCFQTAGPPSPVALSVHGLDGESVRLLGSVNPENVATSEEQTITVGGAPTGGSFTLSLNGEATEPIPFNASGTKVRNALEALLSKPQLEVYGLAGGPYTVVFGGEDAGVDETQMTADPNGLTPSPSAAVTVVTTQQGGENYQTKYSFEYVTQQQFESSEFADAQRTSELPVGSGDTVVFVGQDVGGLSAGETYRYRLVASSTFPGHPFVFSGVQSLSVPGVVSTGESACPNASVRSGPSAGLPDCRAYEQITPVNKEGAQEPFNYGPTVNSGVLVGEDGGHALVEDPVVNWGGGPTAGDSPYFFSRGDNGWGMLAGSPQPQTGVQRIVPELFSDDLSTMALEADVYTSLGSGESKEIQFEVGPAGGPYTVVATVPRKEVQNVQFAGRRQIIFAGWVASSADFSKLILQLEDPNLVEPHTLTKSGLDDLYEYSGGRLSQVNVGVGTCGARIAWGNELHGLRSSSNAVSADGSSVFFEAVPGKDCSGSVSSHVFVRKDGSETIDLGAYRFGGANPAGTTVLLESENSEGTEYSIYEAGSSSIKKIFPTGSLAEQGVNVLFSQNGNVIYFQTDNDDLYRYDVVSKELVYLFRDIGGSGRTSPDGRFYYFQGSVPGMLGVNQVFLYDSSGGTVECVSCASPFNPAPKLGSFFPHHSTDNGLLEQQDGRPNQMFFSEDGRYAFFDTPAALVSSDVDGEVAPTLIAGAEFQSQEFSLSSDVYEWRGYGVSGCARLVGCLSLITNGRGGFLNLLLGTTSSGDNVFIYTRSQLVGQDNDNSGDVYDVRVDGGFPGAPPGPVECEGSECSTPASMPNDLTPSSSTFTGSGNVVSPSVKGKAKPKKGKAKKPKAKKHKKGGKRKKHKKVKVKGVKVKGLVGGGGR